MTIRLALIGLGKIARDQHLPAIAATPGLELVAVASPGAALPGIPCFDTMEALLAAGLPFDAVASCTPPQARRGPVGLALAAGKHALLEKSPGATVSEVLPLVDAARAAGVTLFTTWHSRYAAAVAPMAERLAGRRLRHVRIEWREDVRVWHPGQDWIFAPGGLGAFDAGINALSILTRLLPHPPFVTGAVLEVPANKHAPIAAQLDMADETGLPIRVKLDFLHPGEPTWSITVETDAGTLCLSRGGLRLEDDGRLLIDAENTEYCDLYARFVALIAQGESEVDLLPLQLVADTFLLAERRVVAPFVEQS